MPKKKYLVTLTAEERQELKRIISSGKAAARKIARARMLLKADQSDGRAPLKDDEIAEAVEVSVPTIERVRKRFVLEGLEAAMEVAREVSEAVRAMRAAADIKNRQPLRRVVLVGEGDALAAASMLGDLIAEEANVKAVETAASMEGFLERRVRPNMGTLGPRYKGDANKAAEAIRAADPAELLATLEGGAPAELPGGWTVTLDDLMVDLVDRGEFRTTPVAGATVVLEIELDEDLLAEGLVREVVRRVQEMRKEMDLDLEERVRLAIDLDAGGLDRLSRHLDHLKEEVRAEDVALGSSLPASPPEGMERTWDIDGTSVVISVLRVR